jgi:SAM-dependent methyltransferase
MLHILSPKDIARSPYRSRLAAAGIKGGWNYALDHAWLFERIDLHIKERQLGLPVILDVGCGNSMLHPFLERELSLGIVGIDRIDGLCPHPQRTDIMDFCDDFREIARRFEGMADIVFWLSSIEHNPMPEQKELLKASLRALKPGGLFLATFGFSPETHYFEPSQQTNLSARDAVAVFGTPWESEPDFAATVAEFRLDLMELDSRHLKRYGTTEYDFVVAGAAIVKE